MKIIKNKKGGMFDLILAIALSFIAVTVMVFMTYAQNQVEAKLYEVAPNIQKSFDNDTNVTQIIADSVGKLGTAYSSFKWISILFIFGYFMSIIVHGFLVRSHPLFFVGYIFVVIIAVIISAYISNTYETLMNTPILANIYMTGFYGASWIFLHLPIWTSVIGFLAGIVMFINLDTGGYYG